MSIQLKGNSESSFSNDVVINGDGLCVTGRQVGIGRHPATGIDDAQLQVGGSVDVSGNITLGADGSASFAGNTIVGNIDQSSTTATGVQLNKVGVVKTQRDAASDVNSAIFTAYKGSTNVWSVNGNGASSFAGPVSAPNTFLALDTGGVLDVKERIQNTQAILYRLKAALIQPDADANQLRTRLLEALDILTSDGDES